ncbi:M13 family metallopeptidase [Zhouia spongiae]|uniref:M13 family metallopeptidase n=1 Tax=Zhouia spongiae TaxID=2202721 RepID=A0ABY3YQB3_9FLAO|nr:M13 family metallopeptidase [Zhouia spongiae]UNZ00066.1 M13 family metallopeptidase [Zhouia spongiae]
MKLKVLKPVALGAVSVATVLACKTDAKKEESALVEKIPGINLELMDTTVSPKNDFFRYVNGKWVDNTEIPASRASWGSFYELRQKTDEDALNILKEAVSDQNLDPNSDQAKAVFLFQTIMDTVSRNEQGVAPLNPYLEKINAITDVNGLQAFLIEMEPKGGAGLFGFGVGADAKDSNKNRASIGVGALGLPDRDYYMLDDEDSKNLREKYVKHITKMLQFIGYEEEAAAEEAKQVLAFETKLAVPRLDKVQRRDPGLTYNPTAIEDLQKMTPSVNWKNYLDGIGASAVDTVNISQLDYFKSLSNTISQDNLEDIKAYLRWNALNGAAGMLTTDIEYANWEFYSKTLRGAQAQRARDERALQNINWTLGEALGKLYVEKVFPPEAKAQAVEMIQNIIKAYKARINALPWMDADTKEKAIEKLTKTTIKVGYPDQWKDYSDLEVRSTENGGSYLQNMLNVAEWRFKEDIAKLGKPVDKTEWFMAPQVVNAYYNPSYNEIVFPAAILQPPFFNFTADAAVNYGGIGAVIGHEISHGFDDSGADYDADGNLVNWWTDKDLEEFNRLGDSLAAQYSKIEVLPGVHINGKFTLGENIGDLGGVNAAYDGLQIHLKENGNPGEIDGYTPEQRLFMSWATVWRTKSRDEALKNQVKTDPHSPGRYRATQPLLNIDAFYEAFDITENDEMYLEPEKRVKIW